MTKLTFVSLSVATTLLSWSPGRHLEAQAITGTPLDFSPVGTAALRYRLIGPHRGSRVTAVAGVTSEPFTFYMGAAGGGVWKTTDAGETWLKSRRVPAVL